MILKGCIVPSFYSFWYYYVTKVKGFSQFTYGLMDLVGQISLFIGAVIYGRCLTKWEFRTVLSMANLIAFTGAAIGIIFIMGWHRFIWIPDVLFYSL